MKKVLTIGIFIFILVFCMQLTVNADMGIPGIRSYTAKVINPKGAEYFIYDGETGVIPYGTEVTVIYESEYDDITYANCRCEEVGDSINLKFEDIKTVNEDYISEELNTETVYKKVVVEKEGVTIYKGPSFGYDATSEVIPFGEEVECYQEYGVSETPWFYVTYRGTSGWICELDALGTYKEGTYIIAEDTSLRVRTNSEQRYEEIDVINAHTRIENPIYLDPWNQNYLVKYNGNWGYIERDAFLYELDEIKSYEVADDNKPIYDKRYGEDKKFLEQYQKEQNI